MRSLLGMVTIVSVLCLGPAAAFGQSAQEPSASVPRLINITGAFRPADGQPPAGVETVTLAIASGASFVSAGGTLQLTISDKPRLQPPPPGHGPIPPATFGDVVPDGDGLLSLRDEDLLALI